MWQNYVKVEPRIQPFTRMLSYARPTPKLTRWKEIIANLQRAVDTAARGGEALGGAVRTALRIREAGPLVGGTLPERSEARLQFSRAPGCLIALRRERGVRRATMVILLSPLGGANGRQGAAGGA